MKKILIVLLICITGCGEYDGITFHYKDRDAVNYTIHVRSFDSHNQKYMSEIVNDSTGESREELLSTAQIASLLNK